MARIYIASSRRNAFQPQVVEFLQKQGHDVYDFRNQTNDTTFDWREIDPQYRKWNLKDYQSTSIHPKIQKAFSVAYQKMQQADCCVLVLPAGRSAHSEAGWMKGAGIPIFVYSPIRQVPELMYLLYDRMTNNLTDLQRFIQHMEHMNIVFKNPDADAVVGEAPLVPDLSRFRNKIAVAPGDYPGYRR